MSLASWLSTAYCFSNLFFLGAAQRGVGKVCRHNLWRDQDFDITQDTPIAPTSLRPPTPSHRLSPNHLPRPTLPPPSPRFHHAQLPPSPAYHPHTSPCPVDSIPPIGSLRPRLTMGFTRSHRGDVGTRRNRSPRLGHTNHPRDHLNCPTNGYR